MFYSRFMLFPTFLERKKIRGGGGGGISFSHFMFSSRFMLFPTRLILFPKMFIIGNIENCPFTYWLNGRWFLQIVDREFEHGVKWK